MNCPYCNSTNLASEGNRQWCQDCSRPVEPFEAWLKKHNQNTPSPKSLIKCPACEHEVSSQAMRCPSCGQPLRSAVIWGRVWKIVKFILVWTVILVSFHYLYRFILNSQFESYKHLRFGFWLRTIHLLPTI